ncbi:RNA polymerase sigma factor [Flavitalea flava]
MHNKTGNNLTDQLLVDKVLGGDTRAFATIIRNTERLVAQIVFKMVSHAEDRKDLAQDIYLKVFHYLPGFKFQSRLSTWIARIAYNACLTHLERKKLVLPGQEQDKDGTGEEELELLSNRSISDSGNETEKLIFQKELSGILQEEISGLPPVYRILITLFHHEEMSYEELCLITGLPAGSVKSYLYRARKMLKTNLLAKYKKEAL